MRRSDEHAYNPGPIEDARLYIDPGLDGAKETPAQETRRYRLMAAKYGSPGYEAGLGRRLVDGYGITKDTHAGVRWYRRAAQRGDAWAQLRLAAMYAKGEHVPQNDREAFDWYRRAAADSDIWPDQNRAYREIADGYRDGKGVAKDEREATGVREILADPRRRGQRHHARRGDRVHDDGEGEEAARARNGAVTQAQRKRNGALNEDAPRSGKSKAPVRD